MKTLSESIEIQATPQTVFTYADDIRNVGWHMMESSAPLMGSRLNLEILSKRKGGVGATYRWHGRVLGFTLDFTETVTKWVPNKEKVWHTIGNPRILIMSAYEMRFSLESVGEKARLTFEISYDLPRSFFWKFIGFLLADWYSKWCLKNMCRDAKRALEEKHKGRINNQEVDKTMELNTQKLSFAATITMGIAYIICAVFTALVPDIALKFLGWIIHIVNVEKFAGGVQITFGSFVLGLLPILFYTYLITYLFGWLYNRFTKPKN